MKDEVNYGPGIPISLEDYFPSVSDLYPSENLGEKSNVNSVNSSSSSENALDKI